MAGAVAIVNAVATAVLVVAKFTQAVLAIRAVEKAVQCAGKLKSSPQFGIENPTAKTPVSLAVRAFLF